jgi:8-oxo-dGTP diphosphatase
MMIRVGCAALAVRNGRLLLGRSAKGPIRGKVILPGGKVEFGESYVDTVKREIREESGLIITPRRVVHVAEIIDRSADEHRIVIYVDADIEGDDEPKAGSDLIEAGLYDVQEIAGLVSDMTPTTLDVLRITGWEPSLVPGTA